VPLQDPAPQQDGQRSGTDVRPGLMPAPGTAASTGRRGQHQDGGQVVAHAGQRGDGQRPVIRQHRGLGVLEAADVTV